MKTQPDSKSFRCTETPFPGAIELEWLSVRKSPTSDEQNVQRVSRLEMFTVHECLLLSECTTEKFTQARRQARALQPQRTEHSHSQGRPTDGATVQAVSDHSESVQPLAHTPAAAAFAHTLDKTLELALTHPSQHFTDPPDLTQTPQADSTQPAATMQPPSQGAGECDGDGGRLELNERVCSQIDERFAAQMNKAAQNCSLEEPHRWHLFLLSPLSPSSF